MRRLLREPTLHFALLGAGIFAASAVLHPSPDIRPDPDADHEALYREAIALGLDRGDPIVRRRLVQKMRLREAGWWYRTELPAVFSSRV